MKALWRILCLLCVVMLTQAVAAPLAPLEHRRGLEQTWLSVPEWYRVHSPTEFAAYLSHDGKPSDFPWLGHVGQLWGSYAAATRAQLRDARSAPNAGYHLTNLATAGGTSVEYSLRAGYELTAGRLAELTRGVAPTAEETLAARVAQDYADFIRTRPWYEFDFFAQLAAVWRDTGAWGPDLLRKWERKYALTTEYLAKGLCAQLVRLVAPASASSDKPTTAIVVDRWLDRIDGAWPEMQRLRSYQTGGQLLLVPRHAAFSIISTAIARSGANFVEIAGNGPEAPILLSVLAGQDWKPRKGAVLLRQPVLTQPRVTQVVFSVPISALAESLRDLDTQGLRLEHLHDY
ncbi:hypothetical protein [Viridibacterium curvum]|uniref:Uncharacterized protein n=1 Tax=Viridibacterium curvum TaxID=1101404 RepID=A0ABP9QKJ7_9RHOO